MERQTGRQKYVHRTCGPPLLPCAGFAGMLMRVLEEREGKIRRRKRRSSVCRVVHARGEELQWGHEERV